MPSQREHYKSSKERTGKEFKKLHNWMDEGQKYLGKNHRFERHSNAYLDYVYKTWKVAGVIEFLHHIIDDFETTLKVYQPIADLPEDKQDLYLKLRALRYKIAKRDKTSTVGVFSNKMLREMCIKMPLTITEMLEIEDIPENKVEKYGKEFLSIFERDFEIAFNLIDEDDENGS